jgi:hypothetical protein
MPQMQYLKLLGFSIKIPAILVRTKIFIILVEGKRDFLAQSWNGHISPTQKFLEKRSDRPCKKNGRTHRDFLKIKCKTIRLIYPQIS